ncbi:MAG TPA: alginate lyase family protein, partial [Lacipirellulaceae bacterium]|nr:alginate lyase family protein [Lacipirellulaceae bacterium]
DDLEAGVITLMGEQRALGEPLHWDGESSPKPSQLWRFHLHYQEYLLDLASNGGWKSEVAWRTIWKIVHDWIEQNPLAKAEPDGDAWHPYCVSRRLAVWLQLAAAGLTEGADVDRVLSSCAEQAEFLSRQLELDLGGNHLLENAHALALAGAALTVESSGRGTSPNGAWLRKADKVLRRELPRQLLAHGEHFERSPMYHCQVLGNLLQIAIVAREAAPESSRFCRREVERMWTFLAAILHPDGEIPLFGDSCFGESYSVAELRRLLELADIDAKNGDGKRPAVGGPYWVWRHENDALIFDTGESAADCLPAHGHCDLLGFEASVVGERWFVDSGAYRYDDGAMRRYCRSSVAHNVVTIDDVNQHDVWSTFRMGYRGRPTAFNTGSDGPFEWASAAHNAYRRMGVTAAERLVVASPRGIWGCFDFLRAAAPKRVTGRLHLAPGLSVERINEGRFLLELGETRRILSFLGANDIHVAAGWYCSRFGRRDRTHVLEYLAADQRSLVMGWLLSPPDAEASAIVAQSECVVLMRDPADGGEFEWRFGQRPEGSGTSRPAGKIYANRALSMSQEPARICRV